MIYHNFKDATEDLERQIHEDGKRVANTIELTNIHYTVANPHLEDLSPHLPWANIEFEDRISMERRNPGNAWKELPKIWEPMMEETQLGDGSHHRAFSYTYAERMAFQLPAIKEELKKNLTSREAFMAIWSLSIDPFRLSRMRVPCTIGYQFLFRDNKLHITYLQRSCNFNKHFQDDVYLALKLQLWMANKLQVEAGEFSHWIGSLHIYT